MKAKGSALGEGIDATPGITMHSSGLAIGRQAASAAGRLMPRRWVVELVGLALIFAVLAAAALTGLATLSSRPSTTAPKPTIRDGLNGAYEIEAISLGVRDTCCRETR